MNSLLMIFRFQNVSYIKSIMLFFENDWVIPRTSGFSRKFFRWTVKMKWNWTLYMWIFVGLFLEEGFWWSHQRDVVQDVFTFTDSNERSYFEEIRNVPPSILAWSTQTVSISLAWAFFIYIYCACKLLLLS